MNNPNFLILLGDDASKWAREFREEAMSLGYSDMDEGWLTDWFTYIIIHISIARGFKAWKESTRKADKAFL